MSKSQVGQESPVASAYGDILIAVALVVATLAIYGQVIGHQFINLDDPDYITHNPMVIHGLTLTGLAHAFTNFTAANWHPLTWISHMVDCQLFGLNAGQHLFVNALLHSVNGALVFWFLLCATGARWPSAFVAALFALHPLHVESVAWAAERKDTLATFFGLLSLIAYVRYARSPTRKRYTLVAVALAFGLMAKPMLVTWPFVMLLLDYWPLRRLGTSDLKKLIVEKIPLFVMVMLSAVITYIAQSHFGAVRRFSAFPISLRLANALLSYAKYIWLTFWPHDLSLYYPYVDINGWNVLNAATVLIVISALCFSQRKQRPYLIVGWLWFLGTMVPVIGIVQVGDQALADRYHYVPSIGLFTALVFCLADFVTPRSFLSKAAPVVAGATLVVLSVLTFRQVQFWRDSFSIFEHTLRVAPDRNFHIEYSLGLAFLEIGKYDEAAAHFEKALEFRPDFGLALFTMLETRRRQGRIAEAIDFGQRAVRALPMVGKTHVELGLALAAEKKNDAAAMEFREAVRLDPADSYARADLGMILFTAGKTRESIPEFEAALRLNPSLETASKNLEQARAKLALER